VLQKGELSRGEKRLSIGVGVGWNPSRLARASAPHKRRVKRRPADSHARTRCSLKGDLQRVGIQSRRNAKLRAFAEGRPSEVRSLIFDIPAAGYLLLTGPPSHCGRDHWRARLRGVAKTFSRPTPFDTSPSTSAHWRPVDSRSLLVRVLGGPVLYEVWSILRNQLLSCARSTNKAARG
jgi:hypothetical protein